MADHHVDLVCFGEILWDLLPSGKVAGGAPFNIVNRAHSLGLNAHVVSSTGQDSLGDELLDKLVSQGNTTQYIQRHSTLLTSTVTVTVGKSGEPSYDIVYPVAWDDIAITNEIISLVRSSQSFVYSSLALRDARSRQTLFDLLPHASLKICDVNLRRGHYTSATIMSMIREADILRANEEELDLVSKWVGIESLDRKHQMKKLAEMFNYRLVITTLGGEGAVCYSNGQWYVQPVFKVNVKDTVGAGDAFLASFIYKYLKGEDIRDCLRFACAVGGITASKSGGTPRILPSEIEEMLQNYRH